MEVIQSIKVVIIANATEGGMTETFYVHEFSLKDAMLVAQTLCELRGDTITAIYAHQ